MKRFFLSVGMIMLLVTSGCNTFPDPSTLIEAPKPLKASAAQEKDIFQLMSSLLPQGMVLNTPMEPIAGQSILFADLNNDNNDEAVVFYRSKVSTESAGALILEWKNSSWELIDDIREIGVNTHFARLMDITGDGVTDLLIGWEIGISAGKSLHVYTWSENKMERIAHLDYDKLDLIDSKNGTRLAAWKRDFADVYNIDIWKWENNQFKRDESLYPSYFPRVTQFYQTRISEVPDAAYYYFYLADALQKSGNPVRALHILNEGMKQKISYPTYDEFLSLEKGIQEALVHYGKNTVIIYEEQANVTFEAPQHLYPLIHIEGIQGDNFEYEMIVKIGEQPLFSMVAYSRDFLYDEIPKEIILFETDDYVYTIDKKKNLHISEGINISLEQLLQERDAMIQSIVPGAPYEKFTIFEEELIIEKFIEANEKINYVSRGGELQGEIQSFMHHDTDYRYFAEELSTFEKLYNYLSTTFTLDAIESYITGAKIIELEGKLAQPNADGGSLLTYGKASVIQIKDLGTEKQVDIKVPIGNSLSYEVISVSFKRTEKGWLISSNPLTL